MLAMALPLAALLPAAANAGMSCPGSQLTCGTLPVISSFSPTHVYEDGHLASSTAVFKIKGQHLALGFDTSSFLPPEPAVVIIGGVPVNPMSHGTSTHGAMVLGQGVGGELDFLPDMALPTRAQLSANTVQVQVSNLAATATATTLLTYDLPKITKAAVGTGAATGPDVGSTVVKLTGTGLAMVSQVYFGSTVAPQISRSESEIDVYSPAGSGKASIFLDSPSGSLMKQAPTFTYNTTALKAATLSETSALEADDDTVSLTTSDVKAGTYIRTTPGSVMIGTSVQAQNITNTATGTTFIVPPGVGKSLPITVTDPQGVSTVLTSKWTYLAPTITSISPVSGRAGTLITVTGTHLDQINPGAFTGSHLVLTGAAVTGSVNYLNDTTITFNIGAGVVGSKATITVDDGVTGTKDPPAKVFTFTR